MSVIKIYHNNEIQEIPRTELQKITGVPYLPGIEFIDFKTMCQIAKKTKGLHMDPEHSWLSAYFRKELYDSRSGLVNLENHQSSPSSINPSSAILMQYGSRHDSSNLSHSEAPQNSPNRTASRILKFEFPDVSLRWIDDKIGWGVFAEQNFQTQEFIDEYSGIVRKRRKSEYKNAYCFEYPLEVGKPTPYIIDAQDMGGIARYVNHSDTPNLTALAIHVDGIHHIILYTTKKIAKGDQLCYDYGPGYWLTRPKPKKI